MYKIPCAGCRKLLTTSEPLSEGARYFCSGCAPKEKARLKRSQNEEKNAELRHRLQLFSETPLLGHEGEWFALALELKCDPVALEALVEVVHEQKWRRSAAPYMYIRVNVKRRSKAFEDPFTDDGRLRSTVVFNPLTSEDCLPEERLLSRWREGESALTPSDIEAAAEALKAVPDEGEREVICAKAMGLTREQFLSGVPAFALRQRAAAWRRLHRHGLPEPLRKALKARRRKLEDDSESSLSQACAEDIEVGFRQVGAGLKDRDLLNTCSMTRSNSDFDE